MVLTRSHLVKSFPQFVVIYTVKGFIIGNEAEVDVLAEIFLLSSFVEEQGSRKEEKRTHAFVPAVLDSELVLLASLTPVAPLAPSGLTDSIVL